MRASAPVRQYLFAIAAVASLTLACSLLTPLTGYGAVALIFLLGVVLGGMTLSRGPVLLMAALSALSWNFLFIPPLFTLHIANVQDALMFATYFIVALVIGNLTSRLKAREHLAAHARIALESERLRKTLLDCVSHELKTPIAAIDAASQELATQPELSPQLAGEIRHAALRLNRVVNNLLDMTRLETGVVRPKLEWCDVRELVQAALDDESESLREREVTLDIAPDLPLVLLDHSLIAQALAKLLANAASYTPPRSPIEVSADCVRDTLQISVSDAGPGLPQDPARVFEKFYREQGSKTGGLGLGLSIARGFVEAHSGRITAGNRLTGGARFTISLRVEAAARTVLEGATT